MRAFAARVLAGAAVLLLAGAAAAAEVCETPPASTGPVSLMILKGPAQVQSLAKSLARGVPVVARDASTVIFRDGRVLTADVEAAGRHLNALGWSRRRIDVVASFAGRRARPARRGG